MGAPESMGRGAIGRAASSRPAPPRPSKRPRPTTSEVQRTVLGLGVPVAPSFLVLDDEETKAYDVRQAQGVSLPALLAECQGSAEPARDSAPATPAAISATVPAAQPRSESFHTVPHFPDDSSPVIEVAESNLHQIDDDGIADELAPPVTSSGPPPLPSGPPVPDEWIEAYNSGPQEVSIAPPPRPVPSRRRSFFSKFLFVAITISVGLLVATELSAAGKIPASFDPRALLTKGLRIAKEKIPWDRLHKVPKF